MVEYDGVLEVSSELPPVILEIMNCMGELMDDKTQVGAGKWNVNWRGALISSITIFHERAN